jgi:hypothetical protein
VVLTCRRMEDALARTPEDKARRRYWRCIIGYGVDFGSLRL